MADPFGDAARSGGLASDLELIEAVLRRAVGVRYVAVVLRDDKPVAYVVPATADKVALRAHVAANLPGSSVPEFAMLEALPLAANGRVDRAVLAAPDYAPPTAAGYVAPRTETERILARVWADVLRVERVGIEDNFFDLSGDSIDTIRMVGRAKEAGLHIDAQDVFQLRTIAAIAAVSRPADPAAEMPGPPADSALVSLSQQEIEAIEAKWR
jgi:acyl carrier protein